MFDKDILKDVIADYKRDFTEFQWKKEHYKWEAVKCFQDNWNAYAVNFPDMLKRSLDKTGNLLTSGSYFPRAMIQGFAEKAPEEVRGAFIALYDERRDVVERIQAFKTQADVMLEKYGDGAISHFQKENAISVYLWLRYPDTYSDYKYSEVKEAAKVLVADYAFKKGAYAANIRNWIAFFNEIREELLKDTELIGLLKSHLTESCWPDSELCTLTMDVVFYISRYYSQKSKVTYLSEITEALKSLGGKGHLNDICKIIDKRGKLSDIDMNPAWKQSVLQELQSHSTDSQTTIESHDDLFYCLDMIGNTWGLRDYQPNEQQKMDLSQALEIESSGHDVVEEETRQAIAKQMLMPVLDALISLGGEASRPDVHNKVIEMCGITDEELEKRTKSGDSIIIKGIDFARNYLNYERFLDSSSERGIWKLSDLGWRILITDELADKLFSKWVKITTAKRKKLPIPNIDLTSYYRYRSNYEAYGRNAFLEEVFMSGERYDTLVALLRHRKNVILQGAPGVGKTFAAKRLAWSMMDEQDESRIQFVQFHQNYAYEDFIMGYKPDGNGFRLTEGIFYEFCQRAGQDRNRDYFFIIDEINRGNLSKIFGELLMLIEKDYRGTPATLAYTRKPFTVPENIYIIGMMNTADRSLAMIDYALRRRFSFYDMEPGFDTEGFQAYQKGLDNETFDRLIECVRELNRAILKDPALGAGFRIGHSYFCNQQECTDEWMKAVVYYDILPTLREYWFDDPEKLRQWENRLSGVFDD